MKQERITSEPTVLPFKTQLAALVRDGLKTATSRTRKYGDAGDVLRVEPGGFNVRITMVERKALGKIAMENHLEEGLTTPGEFIRIWETIHPRKRYDPDELVWFHRFKLVP